jgi:hypothetical protein
MQLEHHLLVQGERPRVIDISSDEETKEEVEQDIDDAPSATGSPLIRPPGSGIRVTSVNLISPCPVAPAPSLVSLNSSAGLASVAPEVVTVSDSDTDSF